MLSATRWCCDARKQRGLVGHGTDAVVDLLQVVLATLRSPRPIEQLGERKAVLLARCALTARLDGEEARDTVGNRREVGGVVEHDEAGSAESAARGLHALVAQRRIESGCR